MTNDDTLTNLLNLVQIEFEPQRIPYNHKYSCNWADELEAAGLVTLLGQSTTSNSFDIQYYLVELTPLGFEYLTTHRHRLQTSSVWLLFIAYCAFQQIANKLNSVWFTALILSEERSVWQDFVKTAHPSFNVALHKNTLRHMGLIEPGNITSRGWEWVSLHLSGPDIFNATFFTTKDGFRDLLILQGYHLPKREWGLFLSTCDPMVASGIVAFRREFLA